MGPSEEGAPAGISGPSDRREWLQWVACLSAACLGGPLTLAQGQSPMAVHKYGRTLLVDKFQRPFKSARLGTGEPFIFTYPYASTPVFLMALPSPPAAVDLVDDEKHRYRSLPGIGPRHNIVAYSAICAHKLMYPTPQISFINIRKGHAGEPAHVVHCCGDNSRYDPTRGGRVIGGPAPQPLAMIELEWDPASDQLHALGVLGGEMFDAFFEKYDFRLKLDHGPKAKDPSAATSVVRTAADYSHQLQSCRV